MSNDFLTSLYNERDIELPTSYIILTPARMHLIPRLLGTSNWSIHSSSGLDRITVIGPDL